MPLPRIAELRAWVEAFCKARRLSGIVCIDFIVDDATGVPFAIECNPRFSSNIAAFYNNPEFGAALVAPDDGGAPAAFALRYFSAAGIVMDSAVNPLLAAAGSPFQLKSAAGCPAEWADAVTLTQLLDHTGLGMHYVNGVPRSEPFPPVLALISGTAEKPAPHRYASLELTKAPGSAFGYSGGGFLVLQHLLLGLRHEAGRV